MHVIDQPPPQPAEIPGVSHATWACAADGVQLAVWRQSLAPGAATPPHTHECDEVVLCLAGSGEVVVEGERQPFGPNTTVLLPRCRPHQLFNVGTDSLEIIGMFGESPVRTRWPDGSALEVPWRT